MIDNTDIRGIVRDVGGTDPPEGTIMAKMLIKGHHDASVTKAACHCGRRTCSRHRADLRRTARRVEKAAVRREIAAERAA